MVTVLSAAARYRQPWANELGTTSEVMIWPPGSILVTCKLRVSIADIVIDSAFSALNGIDRTLVALAGGGIDLLIDGQVTTLEPFEVARFSGDSVVSGGPRGAAGVPNVGTLPRWTPAKEPLRPGFPIIKPPH